MRASSRAYSAGHSGSYSTSVIGLSWIGAPPIQAAFTASSEDGSRVVGGRESAVESGIRRASSDGGQSVRIRVSRAAHGP
jgi:hypothetical protein